MIRIKTQIKVDAPIELVWRTIAKLDGIASYTQGIKRSWMTSNAKQGIGAQRSCEIPNIGTVAETIVAWNEGTSFKYEVAGMPSIIRKLSNTWEVRDVEGQVVVTSLIEIHAKYGLIGKLLERVAIGPRAKTGVTGALAQLKYYLEGGQIFTGNIDTLTASLVNN